ncbi:hypothetical protein [Pontibacter harenae]|uniref:hypothetical protein n=1 Tax=Pontibacter harenae TaxID=2894083 RepID=UPI001E425D3F|nr:hypothetical protein [Pontibacter harenae]MCC9165825.1 hypothetical protein [Pontibacter harenae]
MKQNKDKEPLKENTKTMSSDKEKIEGSSQPSQAQSSDNGKASSEDAEAEKGHA